MTRGGETENREGRRELFNMGERGNNGAKKTVDNQREEKQGEE